MTIKLSGKYLELREFKKKFSGENYVIYTVFQY